MVTLIGSVTMVPWPTSHNANVGYIASSGGGAPRLVSYDPQNNPTLIDVYWYQNQPPTQPLRASISSFWAMLS